MGNVIIEGSSTPCVELPTGQRRTVALTEHVRMLIRRGYVLLIDGDLGEKVNPVPEPIVDDEAAFVDDEAPIVEEGDEVPAANASRERWADFLRAQGVPFPDGDKHAGELWASRDELRVIWQQAHGGS